jgi:N-acetylglucosaminyl-diphospho-decaprenol L-rhamnosyltransferase
LVTTVSTDIDAVVVSYRSGATLRGCVESLAEVPGVRVTVVDNASPDDSLATIADLPLDVVRSPRNGGFSYGCNLGAARGQAPLLLFLNPDARIDASALDALREALLAQPSAALVGPRILDEDGALAWSQRRFPRRRSTFAQALFLHRLWPLASWTDELIRDPGVYERPGTPDWVSGACMLVRRAAFTDIGGFDEGFFLYCEDTDLCKRIWDLGFDVRYEPLATARHHGGHSAPRSGLLPVLAESRLRYARKHAGRTGATAQTAAIALHAATHWLAAARRPAHARGHAAALRRLRAAWFAASSHPT